MAKVCEACGRDPAVAGSGKPDCPSCSVPSPPRIGPAPSPASGKRPALQARDPSFRARHTVEAGAVFATSVRVWLTNLGPFLAVTVVILSPMLIYGLYMATRPAESVTTESAERYNLVHMFAGGLLRILVTAAIIGGVFRHLRGDRIELGALISGGVSRVLPAAWTGILSAIFTFLPLALPVGIVMLGAAKGSVGLAAVGGVVTIVGAIVALIVSTALYVAVPAAVVEKTNGLPALKRSLTLTKGHRGQIFVILLALGVLGFIAGFGIAMTRSYSVTMYGSMAIDVLGGSFGGVFAGVVYYNLRATKEGIGIEALAKVFD